MYLRAYQAGDETAFTPTPQASAEMAFHDWTGGPPSGPTWALCRADGEVAGVVGLFDGEEGALYAWTYLAPLSRREAWWAGMLARGILRRVIDRSPVKAWVRGDRPSHIGFLERLGFELRPNVGRVLASGLDYLLMERTA